MPAAPKKRGRKKNAVTFALNDRVAGPVIAAFTALSRERIGTLAAEGIVPREGKLYPFLAAVRAVCEYRAGIYESKARVADKARREKAEADEAELRAMEAGGKLCAMSDAKQFWSDARIEVRQKIERASYLTPVQRTRLLADLAALKTKLTLKE